MVCPKPATRLVPNPSSANLPKTSDHEHPPGVVPIGAIRGNVLRPGRLEHAITVPCTNPKVMQAGLGIPDSEPLHPGFAVPTGT